MTQLLTETERKEQARITALYHAPRQKHVEISHPLRPLTAEEIVKEAEIIYQWLIKIKSTAATETAV